MLSFVRLFALALLFAGGAARAQVTPGTSPLSIAKGGTAAATASAARTSLGVPTGTSGAVLGFLNTANTWSAAQTFPNNSLTLAEFPTIGANAVLGSIAGGTPAALSKAQITTLVNPATASLPGSVPAFPNNTTTFLRGDLTYATLNFAALGGVATGAQLPTPGASSIGGVFSKSCASGGQFIQTVNTDGTVNCATPAGGGNVSGPASSTNNDVATFNGTSGTAIKDSGIPSAALPTAIGQLPGIAANTAASSGNVGEVINSCVPLGSALSLSSGTSANVANISITAGDWDISGMVNYSIAGTTNVSSYGAFVSDVTNTIPTAPNITTNFPQGGGMYLSRFSAVAPGTSTNNSFQTGTVRALVNATTSIFLVAFSNFTVSTVSAYGCITARRRR